METRIRELREAQGLSRRELADRAGLSYTALTKWESGTNEIGFDKAVIIARALHCNVSDLVAEAPQHDYAFDALARNYRALGPEGRAALVATSDALAKQLGNVSGEGGAPCLTPASAGERSVLWRERVFPRQRPRFRVSWAA